MAFLWLRSRANQKPHKAHSASTRRALSAKRERHGRGACEFPLSPVGFRTPTAANPDTKTQEGLCCDVLLCLQGARPRGARAPRRPLATGCAGGGRPNVRKRGARCTRTPKKRILLRRIAPWPLGPPIEIPRAFAHLRPPGNGTQRARNRTPGAAAARLLPVAAAVAVSPRVLRAISLRVIHAVSPRAVRAISPRAVRAVSPRHLPVRRGDGARRDGARKRRAETSADGAQRDGADGAGRRRGRRAEMARRDGARGR